MLGAKAASFVSVFILTYQEFMSVLNTSQHINVVLPDPNGGIQETEELEDEGLRETRSTYLEKIKKYRKLQVTMTKVSNKVKKFSK